MGIVSITIDRPFVCRMSPATQQDKAILDNENLTGALKVSEWSTSDGTIWQEWAFSPGTWKVTEAIRTALLTFGWITA